MPDNNETLNKDSLHNPPAIAALGALAIKHLLEYGEVSFFFDENNNVAIAFPGEFALDSLPEQMAINDLLSSGKNEQEVELYLRGRDARLRNRHG